jgi:AraC-like DNA-binding protein
LWQPIQITLHLFYLAHIGGIFIFSLIIVLLILFGKNRRYLNLLLSIGVGGLVWYVVIFLLNATGYIRHFPGLFNKGLPLYYLIGPCFYLYIRGTIYPKYASFHKIDLLHLLVTLPAIWSIIPYCLLDDAGQQYVVDQVAKNPNYLFSGARYIVSVWHWVAWPLSALIYTILQLRLIKNASRLLRLANKSIIWMYSITIICLVTFSLLVNTNLGMIFKSSTGATVLLNSNMVVLLYVCFLALGIAFFVNPSFIYGNHGLTVAHTPPVQLATKKAEQKSVSYPEEPIVRIPPNLELIDQLENYLMESKLYLETGLTLSKLAVASAIPSYKLSELLNLHYQKNFNAYINAWRIQYIIERLTAGDHKFLTLEALSNDAGFASRRSFFTAFKNEMGLSPSAYIAAMEPAQT